MAEVRFFGSSDDEFFALSRQTSGEEQNIRLIASYSRKGKVKFSREVVVAAKDLHALASWLSDFWDETPPLKLADGLIRFIYSHREHIGEGYYHIEFDGSAVVQVYEQLGTSNTFRADQVRALLQ